MTAMRSSTANKRHAGWPTPSKCIPVPLYKGAVYLYRDRETWNKLAEVRGVDRFVDIDTAGRIEVCGDADGNIAYLVGVFDGKPYTLAHELSHVCFMVLSRVGIDPVNDDGEGFCYLLADLIEKCEP